MECDSSRLIIFSEGSEFVNIFNIKDGKKLGSAVARGRGVGEVMSACFSGFCDRDSIISIYDTKIRKLNLYKYSVCDSQRVDYVDFIVNEHKDHLFSRLHCMDNGYKIGYSVFDSKDPLILFDENFKFIKTFGDFPLKDIQEFKGTMPAYVASHKNYIAYATIDFGYIALYKLSDNGSVIKEWDKYIAPPIYDLDPKNGTVVYDDNNLDGIMNIRMTNEYIYCVYSGKTYNEQIAPKDNAKLNEILVFDYNGNPVRKIIPNNLVFYFDISTDNKYIYSYVEDQTGKIIRYAI